ncbi:MAG: enoyl-CoA hydratase/isomerase family protein [Deltaproteobacteria bacterium]|nr:enoyl-CoA hydratase/isomerase family protein [Deltaproteobacteria bacterium]
MVKKRKYEQIKWEQKGEVGYLTLNRPEVLNAWSPTMLGEFKECLEDIRYDQSVKICVIKGEGRSFCAGMDLKLVKEQAELWEQYDASKIMFDEIIMQLQGPLRQLYRLIWESPVIFICEMHGYVVESALGLAMHCDISIVSDDAKLFWRSIGGAGMLWHLWPWTIGMRKTKELLFRSRYILGKEAAEMGMVNKSVPPDLLEKEVDEWIQDMIDRPREFLFLDKISANKAFDLMGITDSMDYSVLAHICSHLSEPGRATTSGVGKVSAKEAKKSLEKRVSPYKRGKS